MERRRIEIRGADPIKERWGPGQKTEADRVRSQAIMARLDVEQRNHPNCRIQIRYNAISGFELLISDEEDQIQEQRFAKVKEIYEKRGESAYRAEVRRAFLY